MKIEHSDLLNEFISFWFETKVDSKLCYETFLDYIEMTWETITIETPKKVILAGKINKAANESDEEQRIRDLVTVHLQNT